MSDRNASRTALGTAYMRAAHQVLEGQPRVLDDPLALTILGPQAAERIREAEERYQSPGQRGLRASVVLRSRYAEDRLAEAKARGVAQYVILGAGFDTFVLRQPEWARSLRIVEVDHKGTQDLKREMLASAGLEIPGNAQFATVDFERESLLEGLQRYGIQTNRPTFFSWLGVTMYLNETAIDATLKSIAAFPLESEVVLTYAPPHTEYQSPFEQRAVDLGEPWISFFTSEQMSEKLLKIGFSHVEFLSSIDAYERYFRVRPPDLEVPRRPNIVSAIRAQEG
jgi:methyltransferase (TIGR00027 family)